MSDDRQHDTHLSTSSKSSENTVKPCFCFETDKADFYSGFTIVLLVCHCIEMTSIVITMIASRQYGISLLVLIQATLITLNSMCLYSHYNENTRGSPVQFCYAITMYILTWVYASILIFVIIGFFVYQKYYYFPAHLKTLVSLTVGVSAFILLLPLLVYTIYLMHLYYGVVSDAVNNLDNSDKDIELENRTRVNDHEMNENGIHE